MDDCCSRFQDFARCLEDSESNRIRDSVIALENPGREDSICLAG